MEKKYIIWTSDFTYEEMTSEDTYEGMTSEEWKEELDKIFPFNDPEAQYRIMEDLNNYRLREVRKGLNIYLKQPILVIADLGLWNGRRNAYTEIKSGNIADCFYSNYDYTTWYMDRYGDLRCDDTHHDGTNHYLYRVYKPDTSEIQKENIKRKILNGTLTRRDITRVTIGLGHYIGKVYNWAVPNLNKKGGK